MVFTRARLLVRTTRLMVAGAVVTAVLSTGPLVHGVRAAPAMIVPYDPATAADGDFHVTEAEPPGVDLTAPDLPADDEPSADTARLRVIRTAAPPL